MLLPALNAAREKANSSQCINNLNQIGKSIFFYSDDYNGRTPPCAITLGGTERGFAYLLFEGGHLPNRGVLGCPTLSKHKIRTGDTASAYPEVKNGLTYAANMFMMPFINPDWTLNVGTWTRFDDVWPRFGKITRPSERYMIVDQYITWSGYPEIRRWDRLMEGHHWNVLEGVRVHQSGVNTLYGDGHVAWFNTLNTSGGSGSTAGTRNYYLHGVSGW